MAEREVQYIICQARRSGGTEEIRYKREGMEGNVTDWIAAGEQWDKREKSSESRII